MSKANSKQSLCLLLAWVIVWPWKWRQHVPLKHLSLLLYQITWNNIPEGSMLHSKLPCAYLVKHHTMKKYLGGGGVGDLASPFLTSELDQPPLPTVQKAGWVTTGLHFVKGKICCLCQVLNPGFSAGSPLLYQLSNLCSWYLCKSELYTGIKCTDCEQVKYRSTMIFSHTSWPFVVM
jgi:hypothetical protein